jgi:hypothetical protein
MMKKCVFILAGIWLFVQPCGQLSAQEIVPADPLWNFRHFYEIGLSASGVRVNTNYTHFNTPSGVFDFRKNRYLPVLDASFNFGWLLKDREDEGPIWTVKTGLNILNRNADLRDSNGQTWRLSTSYIQLPVQFGYRIPMNFNTVKNNLYRAFELNAGVYAATPLQQKLDHPDNVDTKPGNAFGNYLRFGFIGEILFTAFNSKGHGHKFGLRVSADMNNLVRLKETPHRLYPYYYSLGIVYNILNRYS